MVSDTNWNRLEDDFDRLRTEGEAVLVECFQRHQFRLERMIAFRLDSRLTSRIDADDILQDVFVEASRRLSEYLANPSVPLFVWLRFLVIQKIAEVHRWHSRKKRDASREIQTTYRAPSSRIPSLSNIVGDAPTPSRVASRLEMQTTLSELLGELEQRDREILCLRHFEELTNLETASELAITPAAASKRYVRALEKLRQTARERNLDN